MSLVRLLLITAVLVAGCASGPDTADSAALPAATPSTTAPPATTASAAPDASPHPLVTALCGAAAADAATDAEAAFGRAHDELHTLARELEDRDQRAVAGELLVAKQRVEAAFAADPVPDDLTARLDDLVEATADALAATGLPRPTCPESSR